MLSIGAIPDDMLDAIINGAFDRSYTGEDAIPGDAELFRQGGYDPAAGPQRRVAHSQDGFRERMDSGEAPYLRGLQESRWRTPDNPTLDAIMTMMEQGGQPSPNDEMMLDMMKVDGFGDGQEQLMDRFDDLKSQRFGFSEEAGDWDDEPGWPSTTRGDPSVGRPGPSGGPPPEDLMALVQAMMGSRTGTDPRERMMAPPGATGISQWGDARAGMEGYGHPLPHGDQWQGDDLPFDEYQ